MSIQKIALAPMEGVMDAQMRRIITAYGHLEHCVCEFIRINDKLLPPHVFYKICPELLEGGRVNNVPVHVQLLGQNPQIMAENAHRACHLGAPAIDINFGCPAKTVNKSKGGAVLLKEPQSLYRIAKAVREAVAADIPVSAKIRLGYEDTSLAFENLSALIDAGMAWITVHGRTKIQAYKGKADWQMIGALRQKSSIPIIANGDIVDKESAESCAKITGCNWLMVGRGALAIPNIAAFIKGAPKQPWQDISALLYDYDAHMQDRSYYSGRIKQWLRYLKLQYKEAEHLFEDVKTISDNDMLKEKIAEKTRL